jgi:hypothetical protein
MTKAAVLELSEGQETKRNQGPLLCLWPEQLEEWNYHLLTRKMAKEQSLPSCSSKMNWSNERTLMPSIPKARSIPAQDIFPGQGQGSHNKTATQSKVGLADPGLPGADSTGQMFLLSLEVNHTRRKIHFFSASPGSFSKNPGDAPLQRVPAKLSSPTTRNSEWSYNGL